MCGRYYVDAEERIAEMLEIIAEINRKYPDAQPKRGEIRPTDLVPVVLADGAATAPAAMRWGFPRWGAKGVVINARAETASQKGMFRGALARRRVAVPTNGFYEWRHEGGRAKEKYLFSMQDEPMLYLAGLCERFVADDGVGEDRFAILTTAPNDSMRPFHDRMPVLLARGEVAAWIHDGGATGDILARVPPALLAAPADPPRAEQQSLF